METISRLFGKSPFGALHKHMLIAKACAEKVIPLIEAFIQGEKEKYTKIAEEISVLEAKADSIKNDIRDNLPSSMLMPVNRRDLLVVLEMQDSIADKAQDIGVILTLKDLKVPADFHDDLRMFVDTSVKVCYLTAEVSENVKELVSRFGISSDAENVRILVGELGRLESENDRIGHKITRMLFEKEDEFSPVEIFLWFKLIQLIGDIADNAQSTANRMRSMIAK